MDENHRPLLIFDGDCGFCATTARWAAKGWSETAVAIPWQALGADGLARLGLDISKVQRCAWWVDAGGELSSGHRAVARALRAARGRRRMAGTLLLAPPFNLLGAIGYQVVARHRHRLPGGSPACRAGM